MSEATIRREDLAPGENLCDHCTARCCRYFALPIDTPETWEEFDYVRWYMLHGRVAVFVENGNWFLMVFGDCKHIEADYRCGIYHTRPQICRDYSTDNCEYADEGCYDKYFETPEQIYEYAEGVMPPRPRRKSGDAVALPVLSG